MADSLLEKFDIFYKNPAGAKLGFMLAKDKKGAKVWRRDDERALPDSFAPGDISYANLSPDISKVISHRYMNGGLGALEFEVEDDVDYQILRYLRSQNIDLRCRGKGYPGPKIVSLSLGLHTASAYNQAKSWDDPDTGWTNEASVIDGAVGTKATNAYADRAKYLYIYVPAISCSKLRYYWSEQTNNGVIGLTLDVYYGGTWNTIINDDDSQGEGGLAEAAIGSTQTVTAARFKFNIAFDAAYLHVLEFYAESATVLGDVKNFCVFNGKKYLAKGNALLKLKDDGSGYEIVTAFANDITHLASFPDYLYIALGAANKYWYMDSATPPVFLKSSIAEGEADRFCKVKTSLWQLKLPNKMRVSTNPTNAGSWGSEILCGEATYNVNGMWEHDGILYCLKKEGPYYYNSTDAKFYPAFPELATITHTDSGKNSTVFRGGLYFRMGNQQEWEIKDGVLTEVTPSIFASGISQYAYPCVARAHDESWLYTIIKRGSGDLAILAGRWEYIAGRARWIWHEIRSIDLTDVATAFVCSVEGRPYLYLGSTVATENVYKVYLPITNDATADTGYKFHTGVVGSLWTPRYMTLLFAVTKRWQELFMRSKNLSATNYINAYYSTDDGATFPTLLKKFDTSPEQTGAFTNIEATMMNLKFDFVSDSETVPPVLKYHKITALTMMPSVVRFYHTVKCADGLWLKKNMPASPNYTEKAIRDFLDGLRDKVCTLGDIWGSEHTVLVRVGREQPVFDEDDKRPEMAFNIEAVKV